MKEVDVKEIVKRANNIGDLVRLVEEEIMTPYLRYGSVTLKVEK